MSTTVKIDTEIFKSISEMAKDENTTENKIINDILKKEIKKENKIPDHLIANKNRKPNPELTKELIGAIKTKEPVDVNKIIDEVRKMEY